MPVARPRQERPELTPELEELLQVTPADLQSWKRHPVGRLVFRYLEDLSQEYRKLAMELWESGDLDAKSDPDGLRGRTAMAEELRDLTMSDIERLYRGDWSDEEDESERSR